MYLVTSTAADSYNGYSVCIIHVVIDVSGRPRKNEPVVFRIELFGAYSSCLELSQKIHYDAYLSEDMYTAGSITDWLCRFSANSFFQLSLMSCPYKEAGGWEN